MRRKLKNLLRPHRHANAAASASASKPQPAPPGDSERPQVSTSKVNQSSQKSSTPEQSRRKSISVHAGPTPSKGSRDGSIGHQQPLTEESLAALDNDYSSQTKQKKGSSRRGSHSTSLHAKKKDLRRGSGASFGGNSLAARSFATLSDSRLSEESADDAKRPSLEHAKSDPYTPNRANWPVRQPREEREFRRRAGQDGDDSQTRGPHLEDYGPRVERPPQAKWDAAIADPQAGPAVDHHDPEHPSTTDVITAQRSEDVDQTIQRAPAVVHETVKLRNNEVRQEQIYRDIHEHDVYHHILPIVETEILPARHFVPDPNDPDSLKEVSANQIPHRTSDAEVEAKLRQSMGIGERNAKASSSSHANIHPPPHPVQTQAKLTKPKVVAEEARATSAGHVRIDSAIVHPPGLEDLSHFNGPVYPIHFRNAEVERREMEHKLSRGLDNVPEAQPMTLEELTDALPEVDDDGSKDDLRAQSDVRVRQSLNGNGGSQVPNL